MLLLSCKKLTGSRVPFFLYPDVKVGQKTINQIAAFGKKSEQMKGAKYFYDKETYRELD